MDNENERILNTLFTSVRDYDDFGSAIEANETLRTRISGFASYAGDASLIYRWGTTPDRFDPAILEGTVPRRYNRYTLLDRRSGSIKFVIHNERSGGPPRLPGRPGDPALPAAPVSPGQNRIPGGMTPDTLRTGPENGPGKDPPADGQNGDRGPRQNRQHLWFFNAFSGGNYVYIDINHTAYWNTMIFTGILYPACVIALLALVIAIRLLYLRNIEYRDRIEAQQNLVVLGTAASTLAHEIKNPLYSIKLQTCILKKTIAGSGTEEIERIEEEVDRLTALTYRVNDYLRDAAGNPVPVNLAKIIEETSRRLCGRAILASGINQKCSVQMDIDRARSVFENIIRNALEAGSPAEALIAQIKKEGGKITVTIDDRGRGILREALPRIFDPFYTSKGTGTGIGLAISRRFVEAAGGIIALENRPEGGTSVRITLPAAREKKA